MRKCAHCQGGRVDERAWTIRAVRKELGEKQGRRITLQEFGRMIGELEGREPWTHTTVSRWETGRQIPGPATRAAIAALAGIPPSQLAEGASLPSPRLPVERLIAEDVVAPSITKW